MLVKRVHIMGVQPLRVSTGNDREDTIKLFLQVIYKSHSRRLDKLEQRETFSCTY